MSKIKCKLLEISHYIEYLNDYEDIRKGILHQLTNWEEVTAEEYYQLEEYVKKQNGNMVKRWNNLPAEGSKYLLLVREPCDDITLTTIKEMIAAKEAQKIIAEENKRKIEEAKEKARIANEEKKAAAKRKKLEKQIKDLKDLEKELAKMKG